MGVSGLTNVLPVARLGPRSESFHLEATAEERVALIDRFDLVDLRELTADLAVRRRRDTGWIAVTGSVRASVVQTCVITLEPVASWVESDIDEVFEIDAGAGAAEIDLDPLSDAPEPLEGDRLDLGDLVAQTLGLALDPYPRAPSASLPEAAPETMETTANDTAAVSPFAKLMEADIPVTGETPRKKGR